MSTITAHEYTSLALIAGRDGVKRGAFRFEGHEITVAVIARLGGDIQEVRACSDTHPGLTRVLADQGSMRKCGVGRYFMSSLGHEGRGTVADLAERVVVGSLS